MTDEIEKLSTELTRARGEAEELMSDDSAEAGTALVHVGSAAPAVKRHMAQKKQQLAKKQAEVEGISERIRTEMEKRMSEAMEIVGPLREMVTRLEEGIWMVNLYLGREEKIVTLRDGEPAPAGTPIHVRQLVLSMDEETAIDPEENGIDFQDIDRFDEWLISGQGHIDQVLPDEKGIVAIRPRAEATKDYGHPWANLSAQERDKHTYFLVRNGERLYRIWTDFTVDDTMVPTSDEFTQLFQEERMDWETRDRETVPIEPGTIAWERAEKNAEQRQRHFMRMGLVLQGLADRTPIFHPLPPSGVNFLDSATHAEGAVKFIMDAEQTVGTGREPFDDWLKRVNGELRAGMRIVGAFDSEAFRYANEYGEESRRRYGHSRLSPSSARRPESLVPLVLESGGGDGMMVVRYKRTDKRYDYWDGEQEYKRRASCEISPEDKFIIAIDFAEVEDMEAYLAARTERSKYLNMFPLLRAAIRVKLEEAAAEEPFRKLIAAQLVLNNGLTMERAEKVVPSLVQWWKFKNRTHRPLTGNDEDRKALTEIVAEHAQRQKLDATHTPPELLRQLQATHPDALLIARRPDGKHVVLKPENDDNVFVAIGVYDRHGKVKESLRWKLPPRNALSWRIFYESSRWKRWRRGASLSEYLTDPERRELADSLIDKDAIAVSYDLREKNFEVWGLAEFEMPDKPRVRFYRKERHWKANDFEWYRERGVLKIRKSQRYYREHTYTGDEPWNPAVRAQYGERRIVLYVNDAAIQARRDEWDAAEQIGKEGRELERAHSRAFYRIKTQWEEQAEAKRFEEFMAEYGDAELWEGHKKTLEDVDLEWPDALREDLNALIDPIEDGIDIEGKTLGEVAEIAGWELSDEANAHFMVSIAPEPEEPEDDDFDDED